MITVLLSVASSPPLHGSAHLHCTTPALAGGARERSAVQVSQRTAAGA